MYNTKFGTENKNNYICKGIKFQHQLRTTINTNMLLQPSDLMQLRASMRSKNKYTLNSHRS